MAKLMKWRFSNRAIILHDSPLKLRGEAATRGGGISPQGVSNVPENGPKADGGNDEEAGDKQ